ncbi:MAG: type VI secretion system baseplate subunit TssG, partial [bacterium]|nr:type VI secretion system baseplate subunit TssG [bacterium]
MAALLYAEPYLFEFFHAVRLLERQSEGGQPVGRYSALSKEAVRLGVHLSLGFPASEIQSLTPAENVPPLMRVNFMGLVGPQGVLPLEYTRLAQDRVQARDTTLRDFLDIFHHRLLSLFYQAWEKYRFFVAWERGERNRVAQHIMELVGLGTPGLQSRLEVTDEALVYYGGLLSQHPRSATALQQVLADYFGVPVEVEQFCGSWHKLDESSTCHLGAGSGPSEQLGLGAVVGDEVWDQHSVVRIQLGPLTLDQYLGFLPGGDAHTRLRDLTRLFAHNEIDFEVRLVLK